MNYNVSTQGCTIALCFQAKILPLHGTNGAGPAEDLNISAKPVVLWQLLHIMQTLAAIPGQNGTSGQGYLETMFDTGKEMHCRFSCNTRC